MRAEIHKASDMDTDPPGRVGFRLKAGWFRRGVATYFLVFVVLTALWVLQLLIGVNEGWGQPGLMGDILGALSFLQVFLVPMFPASTLLLWARVPEPHFLIFVAVDALLWTAVITAARGLLKNRMREKPRARSMTRGARWQLGLAVVLALALAAFVAAFHDVGGIGGPAFVVAWICCIPPLLIGSLVPALTSFGTVTYALVTGLAAFIIAVFALTPLRRWIDDSDRRAHHARIGAAVGVMYVVTSLMLGYVWIAFSGRCPERQLGTRSDDN